MTCDRCGQKDDWTIMSFFNTDIVCRVCRKREQEHPKYKQAVDAEVQAILNGNFNYEGIGCPPELYVRSVKEAKKDDEPVA